MNKIPFLGQLRPSFAVYFGCQGALPLESQLRLDYRNWVSQNTVDPLRSRLLEAEGLPRFMVLPVAEGEGPPPPVDWLMARGSDAARVARMSAANAVCLIAGPEEPNELRPALWSALAAAVAIARSTGGEVLDESTRDVLRPSPEPPIDGTIRLAEHVVPTFSVNEDGLGWLTTTGMTKFALPELQVKDVPPYLIREVHAIFQAVAAKLWKEVLAQPADRGYLLVSETVELTAAELEAEGEGQTRIGLRYDVPIRPGSSTFLTLLPTQPWAQAVDELFGSTDEVVNMDPELLEQAHQRAKKELPKIKKRFAAGLPLGSTLLVKIPFEIDDLGHEFMWIQVRAWKGRKLQGWLLHPAQYLPELEAGQEVEVSSAQIFDWMVRARDGSIEGGYTEAIVSEWA